MTLFQSIILGLVQGLTEFLPVSSSGHLAIVKKLFSIDTGGDIVFELLLHLGTLVVILVVFRKDIKRLFIAVFGMIADLVTNLARRSKNKRGGEQQLLKCIVSTNYRKFALLLIISTIPTAVIGLIGEKLIGDASDSLIVPGICLVVTGLMLMLSDRLPENDKIPQDVTYREAVIIGIAQGIAVLPGISRSGATICACLFCGLNRRFAVRYSFILSIPVVLGGLILSLKDMTAWPSVSLSAAMIPAAGILTAMIVGFACIRTMLRIVNRRKFRYFAFYCFAVAAVAIAAYFFLPA